MLDPQVYHAARAGASRTDQPRDMVSRGEPEFRFRLARQRPTGPTILAAPNTGLRIITGGTA